MLRPLYSASAICAARLRLGSALLRVLTVPLDLITSAVTSLPVKSHLGLAFPCRLHHASSPAHHKQPSTDLTAQASAGQFRISSARSRCAELTGAYADAELRGARPHSTRS